MHEDPFGYRVAYHGYMLRLDLVQDNVRNNGSDYQKKKKKC